MTANRLSIPEPARDKENEQKIVKTPLNKSVSFTLSTQLTVFSFVPDDIMNLLFIYFLNATDSFNLLRTSKNLYVSFKPTIWQLADHPLRKLLSHGALGELDKAKILWEKDPSLLTCYGTVYHPNRSYIDDNGNSLNPPIDIPFAKNPGRYKYINRTFYQILLMNSEFKIAEEVGKLMTHEEQQNQFDEVFPDGEIKKYNFDLEEAKRLLRALFEAIAKDESLRIERDENYNIKNIIMSDSTREALYKLYAYAKPKSEHEIGLVFDPEFYHEALKLYDEKCGQFNQKWDRYTFWNICVEEWLAGCLGTCFLRPHSQGLGNSASQVGCVLADGSSFFAFRRPSGSVPGEHFYVGYYGGGAGGSAPPAGLAGRGFASGWRGFLELMSSSNESRERLYAAVCKPKNIVMSNSLE
jgi:hypothetical protein